MREEESYGRERQEKERGGGNIEERKRDGRYSEGLEGREGGERNGKQN